MVLSGSRTFFQLVVCLAFFWGGFLLGNLKGSQDPFRGHVKNTHAFPFGCPLEAVAVVPQDPLLIAGTVQQTLAESWDGVKMLDPRRVCFCFTIDLFTHTHTHLHSCIAHPAVQGKGAKADRLQCVIPRSGIYSVTRQGHPEQLRPIFAYWILLGIDPGTIAIFNYHMVPVPTGEGTPGLGLTPPPPEGSCVFEGGGAQKRWAPLWFLRPGCFLSIRKFLC